jgi:broad specificity phosphatase PhoE
MLFLPALPTLPTLMHSPICFYFYAGESYNNVEGRLGGDSDLTPRGLEYSKQLGDFFNGLENSSDFKVWTSWLRRAIDTAQYVDAVQERCGAFGTGRGFCTVRSVTYFCFTRWKTLNEIDSGVCDDLTYEEIRERWPEDFMARDLDKYRYRYPRGESYEVSPKTKADFVVSLLRDRPHVLFRILWPASSRSSWSSSARRASWWWPTRPSTGSDRLSSFVPTVRTVRTVRDP